MRGTPGAGSFDLCHQGLALGEQLVAEAQYPHRGFAFGALQNQAAVFLPEQAEPLQLLLDGRAGGIVIQGEEVALEARQALVELLVGLFHPHVGADHQVALGDALAEHALHAR
ncbi:hypothetical protein D3C86_1476470 [compost metagenome]